MTSVPIRTQLVLLLSAALIFVSSNAAGAQSAADIRVVRRADRRALILLLPARLNNASSALDVSRFILFDLSSKLAVPLSSVSSTTAPGCARHDDRICIELASGAQALDDSRAYLLALDTIALRNNERTITIGANATLRVDPVGARLLAIRRSPAEVIEIAYDVDATGDSTLGVELAIGGKALPILGSANHRAGQPMCYNSFTLTLRCTFDPGVPLHDGDRISAKLVRLAPSPDASRPPIAVTPTTFSAGDKVTLAEKSLCSLCIEGGYSQTTKARSATLHVLWHNTPLALHTTRTSSSGFGYDGSLSPYVNMFVSTDASTKGYINPGLQYTGLIHWNERTHLLHTIVALVTPRAELDKNATVTNFIPLDLVLKPGIGGLASHGIFLGGTIQLWPDIGLEQGWTVSGRDVARAESNNPSRWKGGLSVIARWLGPANPSGFCKAVGCAEIDIQADWQHYKLNDVPVAEPISNRDYGTLSATYKFSDHVGLSFGFNNGNPPPLFVYQRCETLGLSLVF